MDESGWLLFDVGNTRVKSAFWTGRNDDELLPLPPAATAAEGDWSDLRDLLQPFSPAERNEPPPRAAVASVHPKAAERLLQALQYRGIAVELVLRSDGGLFQMAVLESGVDNPDTVGVDRLLGATAALETTDAPGVIVVDCGSAITVNAATRDGRVFQGGAILAGVRLAAEALHLGTAMLPNVQARERRTPAVVGRNTADAIAAGLIFGLAGAVDRLIEDMAAALGLPPPRPRTFTGSNDEPFTPVVATGGDAFLLSPQLRTLHRIDPLLVLNGVRTVLIRRAKVARPTPKDVPVVPG
ncbi:MAG: type III pantothenate kinase [Planctomycetia bacterium]